MEFAPPEAISLVSLESLHLSLSGVMWLAFGVGLIGYVVMAFVYHHHWSYYGIGAIERAFVVLVFNGFALAFLGTAALMAVTLSTM